MPSCASSPQAQSTPTPQDASEPVGLGLSFASANAQQHQQQQQRRVSKPLPEVPAAPTLPDVAGTHLTPEPPSAIPLPQNAALSEGDLAEQWWPDPHAIPRPVAKPSSHDPQPSAGSSKVCSLDAASRRHLWALIQRALHGQAPEHAQDLYTAVLEAIDTLADPHVLAGLQRTACIRWRAEAQIRAAAALAGTNGTPVAPSRWAAKLGWPAAALRNMIQPSHGAPCLHERPSGGFDPRLHKIGRNERVRKRDVALAILSNALWLVSTAGATAHRSVSASEADAEHRDPPAEQPQGADRQPQRDRPREVYKRGALPTFIPPSLPTTALAGPALSSPPRPAPVVVEPPPALHARWDPAKDDGLAAFPDPPRKASKAAEHLASLSVAAGAAVQSQACEQPPDHTKAAESAQSEAAVAETKALERAEREFLARVGQDCEERAKMVLAAICVDAAGESAQRFGSMLSTKSDRTIGPAGEPTLKGIDGDRYADQSRGSIRWQKDRFSGVSLYATTGAEHLQGSSENEGASSNRFKREGGTLVLSGIPEDHLHLLHQTLAVAIYVAASMLLETALLANCGVPRPESTATTPEETPSSPVPDTDAEASDAVPDEASLPAPSETVAPSHRWSRGLWGIFQSGSDAVSAAFSGMKQPESAPSPRHPLQRTSTSDGATSSRKSSSALRPGRLGRMLNSLASSRVREREDEAEAPGSEGVGRSHIAQRASIDIGHLGLAQTLYEAGPYAPSEREDDKLGSRHSQPLAAVVWSASPDISSTLNAAEDADPDIRGLDFLNTFTEIQCLSVLVGAQNAVPTVAVRSPAPLRNVNSYFGSVSSVASVSLPTSRSVSGASAADSFPLESLTVPSTPIVPPSNTHVVPRATFSRREEVVFYRHSAPGRDLHLGHVIDDLLSRAVNSGHRTGSVESKDSTHVVHYLHDCHQITIAARAFAPIDTQTIDTTDASRARTSPTEMVPASAPALESAVQGDNIEDDVAAVAAASQASQDAARTAVTLAEMAIAAAENDSAQTHNEVSPSGTEMWSVDTRSGRVSDSVQMSPQTWLLSFGKYLEALIYHPRLISGGPSEEPGQTARYDVARFFQRGSSLVKITVKPMTIYDLQTEGPVVSSPGRPRMLTEHTYDPHNATRLEIQGFYASVKKRLDSVDDVVAQRASAEGDEAEPVPLEVPHSSSQPANAAGDGSQDSELSTAPARPLSVLRTLLRSEEFALYDALKVTHVDCINDVRRMLLESCRVAKHRLARWEEKHLTLSERNELLPPELDEPEYGKSPYHVFPGSRFIISEDEPLSIIAFSLSSQDYRGETMGPARKDGDQAAPQGATGPMPVHSHEKLAQVLNWRASVVDRPPPRAVSESASSLSSASSSLQDRGVVSSSPFAQPRTQMTDLDASSLVGLPGPEPISATVKRKRRGREASILALTLRRVGSTVSAGSDSLRSQPWDMHDRPSFRAAMSSYDDGEHDEGAIANLLATSGLDPQTLETVPPLPNRKAGTGSKGTYKSTTISSSGTQDTFRAQITQVSGRPASLASLFSRETLPGDGASSVSAAPESKHSDSTAGEKRTPLVRQSSNLTEPPINSVDGLAAASSASSDATASNLPSRAPSSAAGAANRPESPHVKHNLFHGSTKISCVSWFAEEFAALRERWGIEDDFVTSLSSSKRWRATGGKSRSSFFKTSDDKWIGKQLLTVWSVDEKDALLEFAPAYIRYMLNSHVNDCPSLLVKIAGFYSLKVKDTKTGESRLKMSIMVIENLFADASAHEAVRFDLKGIRDRRAATSANKASAAGTQAEGSGANNGQPLPPASPRPTPQLLPWQADKATRGNAEPAVSAVGWDAEWIEQFQHKAFVGESRMTLFTQALRNDLAFLTGSNVMDFSLLVGVTDGPSGGHGSGSSSSSSSSSPTIRVRIVDYISAFTLAKQLESSSKKALKSSAEARGNVTVLPPAEYAARFEAAMLSYFTGVPEGWSHRLEKLKERQAGRGRAGADGEQVQQVHPRPGGSTAGDPSRQLSSVF